MASGLQLSSCPCESFRWASVSPVAVESNSCDVEWHVICRDSVYSCSHLELCGVRYVGGFLINEVLYAIPGNDGSGIIVPMPLDSAT